MSTRRLLLAGEVRAKVQRGLTHEAVAILLGISRSYVRQLLYDPTGEKMAERKRRAAGTCVDCEGPTAYLLGGVCERCQTCRNAYMRANAQPCPSRAAYTRGCRCAGCRAAAAAYARARYRAKRAQAA